MSTPHLLRVVVFILIFAGLILSTSMILSGCPGQNGQISRQVELDAVSMVKEGREIFRHDTFGNEAFWGETLRLHEALATLTPQDVLDLGLKVDSQALPRSVAQAIRDGELDLDDPVNTLTLLKNSAVLGVTGFFDTKGETLSSVGIQCALCHSTVDDTLAPGIGVRLDGWANRDLNVGEIIAAAPDLTAIADLLGVTQNDVRTVVRSWGVGKFDAQLLLDGITQRPGGGSAATLIPPAFGLAGVNEHTWTGSWGTVSYWNAFVANIEMGGQGTFYDPRLNNAEKYPIAAAAGFGNLRPKIDQVTAKLPALQFYQLALLAPKPPNGSFEEDAATRGRALFAGKADCARCHVPPLFTEPGWNLHTPEEIGIDDFQANRAPDEVYRTAPLKGLWSHTSGGFYHDGRFATLQDVIDHYDSHFDIKLSESEKADLEQYLLSL